MASGRIIRYVRTVANAFVRVNAACRFNKNAASVSEGRSGAPSALRNTSRNNRSSNKSSRRRRRVSLVNSPPGMFAGAWLWIQALLFMGG